MNKNEPALIKTKTLLKILGISRSTLYRWIKENKFPPPLNKGFYSTTAVNSWISSEKHSS
ncbi:helix-turn-helix transcriptional regulator [Aeromonas bestiarum]|uniref:helix-turn-helix transcriptional regulator n=1 Tax=Aeromonas bestiarum TaxID=105751 RepID=UPI003D1B8144